MFCLQSWILKSQGRLALRSSDLPEMLRKDESNQRDRGRGGHPPAVPLHGMKWLQTLANEEMDQSSDSVSREMAGR